MVTLCCSQLVFNGSAETSESNPYVVTYADLENATGTTSDGTTTWGIYDSGEADHGKVYVIKRSDWAAISSGNTGVTYTYDSKTYTLFDEPLETNTYYIFSYDHKSFPIISDDPDVTDSTLNDDGRFTIAPPVSIYATSSGTDWRNIPAASDNAWSRHIAIFNSESQTAFNGKINTLGTYTTSYVDNFKLQKATKLDVYNPGGTKLSTDGTGIMYSENLGGYFAPMGESVTIKAVDDESYETIVSVTHGDTEITATDGAYVIDEVTEAVSVEFGLKLDEILESAEVEIKGDSLYTNSGYTYAKLLAYFGMPKGVSEFYVGDNKVTDLLQPLKGTDIMKVVYNGETLKTYNVKLYGDIYADGKITVTDVVNLTSNIVQDADFDKNQADLNNSGLVTVSDIVKMRELIMEQNEAPKQFKVLAIGNSFSIDATTLLASVAKAAGYAEEDIVIGNLWYSGCSLEQHVTFTKNGENVHNFYCWNQSTSQTTTIKDTNLKTALEYADWDYISIQQVSHLAGKFETFQPYADELVAYINEYKTNPDAKIGWHMTWAYPQTPPEGYSSHSGFADYGSDQTTMYNAIVDTTTSYAATEKQIEFVSPVGTAIQNLRAKVGDIVTRDQFHLNQTYARIAASLTWVKAISGKAIEGVKNDADVMEVVTQGVADLAAKGVNITAEELIDMLIDSANDAVANPSSVTE